MTAHLEEVKKIYQQSFHKLRIEKSVPEIDVRFFPYIGINHTIRVRNGKVFVRLAEICREMPLEIHESLAFILISKLLRINIPRSITEKYRYYIQNADLRDKAIENKKTKGRKVITSAKGEAYDLTEIFKHLNQIYFDEAISQPTLTWSARKTYRILGHHDSAHETIVVSKSLDHKSVPKYVVEFVVFHEMLHIYFPTEHRNGRRYSHTPKFRHRESQFAYFNEAQEWIERNIKKLKKQAKAQ